MRGLTGKVAMVTGAARGIGLAIASRLAEEGAKIAIADINGDGAAHAAERIGGAAMGVRVDVTDTASIAVGVAAVVERLGTIDVLVNNAGWDKVEPFVKSEEATWDTVIAINLKGPIACVRAVLDSMIERRSGKIVSISSDAGRVGSAGEAVYAGAKAGIIAFSKTLARELRPLRDQRQCRLPRAHEYAALPRDGRWEREARRVAQTGDSARPSRRAQDLAGAVAFLASDDASFVTGQTLSVSGGLTMI